MNIRTNKFKKNNTKIIWMAETNLKLLIWTHWTINKKGITQQLGIYLTLKGYKNERINIHSTWTTKKWMDTKGTWQFSRRCTWQFGLVVFVWDFKICFFKVSSSILPISISLD